MDIYTYRSSFRSKLRRHQWTLFVGASFVCALANVVVEDKVGLVTLLFGFMLVLILAVKEKCVAQAIVVGYLTRAALVLVHTYMFPLPGSGADAIRFERVGWELAQAGFLSTFEHIRMGSGMYYWFIAAVYSLVGRSPMTIMAVNVILGSLVIWASYRAAHVLWGRRAAMWAAWWVALFPNLVLNSALILREAFITCFVSFATYHLAVWSRTGKLLAVLSTLIYLGLAASLHEGMFIAVPAVLGIVIWRALKSILRSHRRVSAKPVVLVLTAICVACVILASGWGRYFLFTYLAQSDMQELASTQEVAARSRAAYPAFLTIRNPIELPVKLPIRILFFLFAPFPWMVRDVIDLLGLLDSLLYVFLITRIIRCRREIMSDPAPRALLVALAAVIVVFSLAVGNYGTAVRHRAKFAVLHVVVAASYLERRAGQPAPASRRNRYRYVASSPDTTRVV